MSNYEIKTNKKHLTIECKDKTMQDDLNITFEGVGSNVEEWDGAYEEISSGYNITINYIDIYGNSSISYSIDSGATWNEVTKTNTPITLENVSKIKFKVIHNRAGEYVDISTESGVYIAQYFEEGETEDYIPTKDTNIDVKNIGAGAG